MKKALVMLLVVALLAGAFGFAPARAGNIVIQMTIGSTKAYVNSKEVILDQPPVIENGRTLVPFRFIGEAIGAKIDWDPVKKAVSYILEDTKIILIIGSTTAFVNGVATRLDVAPKILSGRTMVPVRFISETIGAKVDWDSKTRMVTVTVSVKEKAPVKIGAAIALTGKYATSGQYYKMAWDLAVDEINSEGGINGRKIQLILIDDQSNPTNTANAYTKLIQENGVIATFGPFTTDCTVPAANIVEKFKVPMLSAGSATAALYQRGYKYYFGVFPPTDAYIPPIMETFNSLKDEVKTIAISYESTDWGKELSSKLKDAFTNAGFKVVVCEERENGGMDYTPLLTKIKSLAPDAYLDAGHTTDEILLARQSKEIKFNPKIWYGGLTADYNFLKNIGAKDAEGVMGSIAYSSNAHTQGNRQFVDAFKKRYNVDDVEYHAGIAYAAAQVLFDALKRAGNNLSPEAIRNAIAQTDMETVIGRVKFDNTGKNMYSFMPLVQIQNGKYEVISPSTVATAHIEFPKPAWGR
jgi:branched-chain amino acid transport system substrate-binding protein